MLISEIRDTVSQGLLDFAWRQWAQVGASATVEGADRWAVDPEALILFTIGIARRDPRLFDEMLDWMAFNRELLSTQRLRNLARRFPLPSALVAAVTAWTRQTAPASPLASGQGSAVQGREPVFSPDVLAFVSQQDPVFAEHGFIRPPAKRTGKSTRAGPGPSGEPVLPAPSPVRARRPLRGDASAAHLPGRATGHRTDRRRSRVRQEEHQRRPDIPCELRGHQGRLGRQRKPLHRLPGEMGTAPRPRRPRGHAILRVLAPPAARGAGDRHMARRKVRYRRVRVPDRQPGPQPHEPPHPRSRGRRHRPSAPAASPRHRLPARIRRNQQRPPRPAGSRSLTLEWMTCTAPHRPPGGPPPALSPARASWQPLNRVLPAIEY